MGKLGSIGDGGYGKTDADSDSDSYSIRRWMDCENAGEGKSDGAGVNSIGIRTERNEGASTD